MENSILTAHRGLTLASPQVENTLEAVKAAIANPEVGAIEIDIQLTKDGEFVLNNYKTLQNIITLNDPSRQTIADYTYDELCKMSFTPNMDEIKQILETGASEYGPHADKVLNWCKSVLSKQSRVTRLEDVLALDRKGKPLFIEIKTAYREDQKAEINDYVRKLIAVCKGHKDIMFIGSANGIYRMNWDKFIEKADFDYDNGYGSAHIAEDLIVYFKDHTYMTRFEYDGSEWWNYSVPKIFNENDEYKDFDILGNNRYMWKNVEEMNDKEHYDEKGYEI